MEVHLHAFLTSVLDGVSVFLRFIAKESMYSVFEDKIVPLTNLIKYLYNGKCEIKVNMNNSSEKYE